MPHASPLLIDRPPPGPQRQIASVLTLWLAALILAVETGVLARLYMPLIGGIVALTIIAPTLWYYRSSRLQAFADAQGHRPIMLLHIWRIPAALAFFWYGAQGALPTPFWVLAGTGDLIAGGYAAWLATKPESRAQYALFHRFGFADFIVAVGTGLTFTLLEDPRMGLIAQLPLALIPLFGVGISGATHIIAFDMLRRGTGLKARP